MSVSRRDVLRSLSMGAAAASVPRVIPLQAAEYAHHTIGREKAASTTGTYTPKFFPPAQYKTLQALCESIFPADADSAGAVEAGAPEFIDLLTSENPHYQLTLGGGIMWLDSTCTNKYGKAYLECTPQQKTEMLHCIAYRKSAEKDASVSHGVGFFAFLRNLAADGFFTSKIGIQYLGYIGNGYLAEFPGCPPVPGV
jgi:gluconate 2-dehydrogenase gamma chain